MRYFIINTYSLNTTEVEDTSWFSNPIKQLGSQNYLMCKLDNFGGYQSKRTFASKQHYYVDFYKYGVASTFSINGWTFPKEIRNCTDSSSRDGRIYNEFGFECTSPSGKKYNIGGQIDSPYIWGILKVMKIFVENDESKFEQYGYYSNGIFYLSFRSFYSSCTKYYPL